MYKIYPYFSPFWEENERIGQSKNKILYILLAFVF